jgi:histidine triad (HIT) family protein
MKAGKASNRRAIARQTRESLRVSDPKHSRPFDAECIFCRIVKGEIPSFRVYDDEHMYGFLDINPVRPGHVLLLPKGHYPSVLDVPGELGASILRGMAGLGRAVMLATGADGFNCLQNTLAAAGQTVFHAHWHIIPRQHGDGLAHWPQAARPAEETMRALADAVARAAR